MMNYTFDFDEIVPRRGTGSMKWDDNPDDDIIPMWVADMDFKTAPAIIDALKKRVEHGVFGYAGVPPEYYDAAAGWFSRRHGVDFRREWFICVPGVVPALSAIIKGLTSPGDKVIIQTPVYNCFFSSIRNNDCEISANPLIYRDGSYYMDFEDLQIKASDPSAKLLILCNPHNPAGRVWSREELQMVGDICMRNNVLVVSDEIHCELTWPGHDYVPFASLSDEFLMNSVTCNSPSKAFNTAGLHIANIIAADQTIRRKIDRAVNINEVCDVGPFGITGLIAAYERGGEWLDALREYLYDNYLFLKAFFKEKLPDFTVVTLEGTYLVWVDCSVLKMDSQSIEDYLTTHYKVRINAGIHYGAEGEGFIRINIACPRTILKEGLDRIYKGLSSL